MKSLEGKVAIVTGGARDIGRAVSETLAARGAKVAVNYFNNEASGADTVKAIEANGGQAVAIKGDMTEESGVDALVSGAIEAFGGGIDIVVNNAGGLVARKSLAEMDVAFFEQVMRLNLTSTFLVSKMAAAHMSEGGSIINLASLAGRDGGGPGSAAYATSKGAVMTFTRSLAKELGPDGIRANCICPGMISTTFHDTFTKDEVRSKVAGSTPLRREGQAQEVADLVAYLASAESSFITGASLDINGGLYFS